MSLFGVQKENEDPNRSKTGDDIDESLKNVSYVLENNIILDTIYLDSLVEMMLLVKSIDLNEERYFVFSKYSMEIPPNYDMSFYYDSHYITKADTALLNDYSGELLNVDSLSLPNPLLELSKCGHGTSIELWIQEIHDTVSICNYVYTVLPLYAHTSEHILIKDCNNELTIAFSEESDEIRLFFLVQDDSVIAKH